MKDNAKEETAQATWPVPDDRTKGAWANTDDTTEFGAYGVALAAIELTRGLVAIRRAETKTGADYYLGKADQQLEDLESSVRLEVSGTDTGGSPVIEARLRAKLEQANKGKSNLPAIASVVGFSVLKVVCADLEEQ